MARQMGVAIRSMKKGEKEGEKDEERGEIEESERKIFFFDLDLDQRAAPVPSLDLSCQKKKTRRGDFAPVRFANCSAADLRALPLFLLAPLQTNKGQLFYRKGEKREQRKTLFLVFVLSLFLLTKSTASVYIIVLSFLVPILAREPFGRSLPFLQRVPSHEGKSRATGETGAAWSDGFLLAGSTR